MNDNPASGFDSHLLVIEDPKIGTYSNNRCPCCGKLCEDPEDFRFHIRVEHPKMNPFKLQDMVAEIARPDSAAQSKYIACNNEGGSDTSESSDLLVIEEPEVGIYNPHRCVHCGKLFSNAKVLQNHVRAHTKSADFKFPDQNCSEAFRTRVKLREHFEAFHQRGATLKFHCNQFLGCAKIFGSKEELLNHIESAHKLHIKQKIFECGSFPDCFEAFALEGELSEHIIVRHKNNSS
ncbi:hypothetical protein B0J14DRAFT_565766 [Halenospora varia]|nr:hypothetical protein B0J14DRAFT_565766 [Halenospora varia]